jgi:hypothetical protein
LEVKVVESCKHDVFINDKASSSLSVFSTRLRVDKS